MDALVENWQRPPNITKPFAQEYFGSEEKQTASRFRDNKSQFVASIKSDVLMQRQRRRGLLTARKRLMQRQRRRQRKRKRKRKFERKRKRTGKRKKKREHRHNEGSISCAFVCGRRPRGIVL